MVFGRWPDDDGNLSCARDEADELVRQDPYASGFVGAIRGLDEVIYGVPVLSLD